MDSFYEISRGISPGKQLTTAQRTSSKFAEEPVVLGKVLRAGARPLRVSEAQYNANKTQLLMLAKAGAIKIKPPATLAPTTEEAIEELGKAVGDAVKEELALDEGTPPEAPVEPPEAPPEPVQEVNRLPEEEAKLDPRPGKKGKKG